MTVDKNINDILRVEGVNARGFGIIPKIAMQDKRLSRDAKCIYAYFRSYAGAGDAVFPGVAKICNDLGYGDKKTFLKHRRQLEEYGYIKVTQDREGGRFVRNIYIICENPEISEFSPRGKFTATVNHRRGKSPTRQKSPTNNNSIYKNNIIQKEEEERSSEDFQNAPEEINTQPELFTSTLDIDQISADEIEKFAQHIGIPINGQASLELYRKWRIDWEFSPEMILLAGELMSQLAKMPNLNYVDRILSDWSKRHIRSIPEAKKAIEHHRAQARKNSPSLKVKNSHRTDICETTGQSYELYTPP